MQKGQPIVISRIPNVLTPSVCQARPYESNTGNIMGRIESGRCVERSSWRRWRV